LYELNHTDYERARPLFRKLDIHLPLQAILAGNVEAPIYVDNALHPQTALTWSGHRFYLAGAPGNTDLIAAARKIFLENYAMRAWRAGINSYIIHYPSDKWETFITAMLQQKYPIKSQRSYYAVKSLRSEWKSKLPDGFKMRTVDAALLADAKAWQNPEFLTEEMCSERESVQDFLAKSFGVALTRADEIVGWCLSEYNTGHRCEVGIATHEDYQRKGLGTLLTHAFMDMARTRDIAGIGWHCNANNVASGATALKAGFEKVQDYPVFIGWFDDVANLAQNGYFAHGRADYAEALAFYEKSLALGDVADWVYWGAACDAALTGATEKALKYLEQAIEHGYDDLDHIRGSRYLVSLHDAPGWDALIKKLEAQDS
jgi:RimJ/RimL family protein N-acetyltransferase